MREGIKSSRIVWDQAGIEELKKLLAEPDIDEDEGDSDIPTDLDFPWEPRVVSQERVVGDGGDVVVNVTLGFDDIPDAEDYEVRVALLPDEPEPTQYPYLGPVWQPTSENRADIGGGSPPATKGSGWHMAEQIGTDNSSGVVIWQMPDDPDDFSETSTIKIRGRTVSLDGSATFGPTYDIVSVSLPFATYAQPDWFTSLRLSDGRAVFFMTNWTTLGGGGTDKALTVLLLDQSGQYLDHAVYNDYYIYVSHAHEAADGAVFVPMGDPSDRVTSFTFTGNTITKVSDSNLPASPATGMMLLTTETKLFMVGYISAFSATRYYSIDRSGATISGSWSAASTLTFGGDAVEALSRSHPNHYRTGTDRYTALMMLATSGTYRMSLADLSLSGTTITVLAETRILAPNGLTFNYASSPYQIDYSNMRLGRISSNMYAIAYVREGSLDYETVVVHTVEDPFTAEAQQGSTSGTFAQNQTLTIEGVPHDYSLDSHYALFGLENATVLMAGTWLDPGVHVYQYFGETAVYPYQNPGTLI